jgi:hypothetical protein
MKIVRLLLLRTLVAWWMIPATWLFVVPLTWIVFGESLDVGIALTILFWTGNYNEFA